jgi:lipoprotein signal peptidase
MNYNIAAYLIYLVMMIFIIIYVGRLFHQNGRIFILSLFEHDSSLTTKVNNILLTAYYLFNIGYAFVTLQHWEKGLNLQTLISSVSHNTGILVFILSVTHYFNMGMIYLLSKHKSLFITTK